MTEQKLATLLDRLAAFEPTSLPVISLYLNAQANQVGRDQYEPFVRKELTDRLRTFEPHTPAHASFERDRERIFAYLGQIDPSANGVAIFACAGCDDFWATIQLDAPIDANQIFVYNQPHLYPLAQIYDQYPRYAALLVDSRSARLFVFSGMQTVDTAEVEGLHTSRSDNGGWSQARFQRHIDDIRLDHIKESINRLNQVVCAENIDKIILSGDPVTMPTLREHLPESLAAKVIDVLSLDQNTPEHQVLQRTLESLREHDAHTDQEQVERLFNAYRAGGGGLGVVGVADTLAALNNGQVDTLIISAVAQSINADNKKLAKTIENYQAAADTAPGVADDRLEITDELVTKARQTGAAITFIEDADLLENVGGVGAILRWRTQS